MSKAVNYPIDDCGRRNTCVSPQSLKLTHLGKKEMFIVIGHRDIVEFLLHGIIMAIADRNISIKPKINPCSVNSHCLSVSDFLIFLILS